MRKILLIAIIILAFILRFYRLADYPAFNADEAAIGYNAYSLIETGRDEHGNAWPVHFQSFNDYKPGLYFYLVLPFVKIFGLNEWSVRAPNALLSVWSVYLIYIMIKIIFPKKSLGKISRDTLGLVSALFLAISPWHLHFSRGGWEVSTATFFILAGVVCFLKSRKRFIFQILSILCFSLSLYTYHAARVITPLIIISLYLCFKKDFYYSPKKWLLAILIMFILTLPLLNDLVRTNVTSRFSGVGLLADLGPINRINEQRGDHGDYNGITAKLLHNKLVNYSLAFGENYFTHFWGEFLFLSGDNVQRDKVPEHGQMYILDILFVIIGLLLIIRKPKIWLPVISFLLIAPVPAALTFQSPHALRSEFIVIPLIIISAYGFVNLVIYLNQITRIRTIKVTIFILLVSLVLLGYFRYLHLYYYHMSKEYPYSSQYGLKELVTYVKENQDWYQNIIVTDKYDQPYILFLFYLKYPPADFQKDHQLSEKDKYGFSTVRRFYKYQFKTIDYLKEMKDYPKSLIVAAPDDIPSNVSVTDNIIGTNGLLYFKIVESK